MANYKDAGVDVEAGYEAVRLMKEHVGKTFRKEVLTGLGGFGSLFELDLSRYEQPVLISGTDGVGTKLKISFLTDRYDTVGIDVVDAHRMQRLRTAACPMCVNRPSYAAGAGAAVFS